MLIANIGYHLLIIYLILFFVFDGLAENPSAHNKGGSKTFHALTTSKRTPFRRKS